MSYATQQDLIDRFGQAELDQVADVSGTGVLDTTRIARALGDADAEIDAALRGRYALPLTVIPELLRRIACDLARESLYEDMPTEVVKERAERCRSLLLGIARGTMIVDAPAAPVAESSAGLVEIVTGRKTSPFVGFGGGES